MRLWLDDERPMPDGFDRHVRTAKEAIEILKTEKVGLISLDHDLGPEEAGSGYEVAKWIELMAFYGSLNRMECLVHSANSVGRKNMFAALANAERFWRQKEDMLEATQHAS